jgi:hypothetical protein
MINSDLKTSKALSNVDNRNSRFWEMGVVHFPLSVESEEEAPNVSSKLRLNSDI